MRLSIDPAGSLPPYRQLLDQIIGQIDNGELSAGTKLPSVRGLATELGIAPNTVAKTYRHLESTGYVDTHGRNGTTVATLLAGPQRHSSALELSRQYLAAMAGLGLDPATVLDYVRMAQEDSD